MVPEGRWTIGRLAKQARCSVEAVRHYERIGLLDAPPRSGSGYRLYGESDLRRLGFIRRSRELGFTQEQIRDLLAAVSRPDYTCAEIGRTVRQHLEQVRTKLLALQRLEAVLSEAAANCERFPDSPSCRFVESLYGPEATAASTKPADSHGGRSKPAEAARTDGAARGCRP